MSENNKTYRIRTNVGNDSFVSVNLEQDFETLDILSLNISTTEAYRLHNSNYGVIVGRVIANNGFGIPNAKISIFIAADDDDDENIKNLYPFSLPSSKNSNDIRYNLLPDEKVDNCHQVVGTFPNKRYLLDNNDLIEVFDKYYKYTTRTNGSGDYIICGVPTGDYTLHMDLDISDCGILSQRPRDFVYKGYTAEQFENPNMFKTGTSYDSLSQIFTQNQNVHVQPFWGNNDLGETIGITRADINVAFKFEPTAVFMGCVASDNASQGISRRCIPTPNMGNMDELVTGEGTIEMIRKTYAGDVEEFQVKGTELIDGNGVWCYQIPMNLDYMVTDEYGNMVPTDNPERGIPTRARVRFRISMKDMEENTDNYFRPKVLVPHNPQIKAGTDYEDYDYEFGTFTNEGSFRDLLWNNVYTVKSYIPRFQKKLVNAWKAKSFSGIKHVQNFGANNPMPYNNIRINLPFMFKVMCILIKVFIKVAKAYNDIIAWLGDFLANMSNDENGLIHWLIRQTSGGKKAMDAIWNFACSMKLNVIDEGLCPDLENWYFAPLSSLRNTQGREYLVQGNVGSIKYNILQQTLNSITKEDDPYSIEDQNRDEGEESTCLTTSTDYLISCIEMNLAEEYKVINFDFYNDWINGLIYIPRFMRYIRKKRTFLGITFAKAKVRGCMDDTKIFSKSRRYTQLCSLGYKPQTTNGHDTYSKVTTKLDNLVHIIQSNRLHKTKGVTQAVIFGKNGGICHEKETFAGQHVYYLKPCEWSRKSTPLNKKINLYATDLVLLGSLNDCDMNGIPQAFKHLSSTSYIMPTNLALTNMEENGPVYTYGNKGVVCSTKNETRSIGRLDEPIKVVDQTSSSALTAELKALNGNPAFETTYDDDPSDTIALTEAAGIAWNYTGPGQGKIDKSKLYYPGGHFLGLSCVNSQTNIKSCVNLERICELGVAMSQRKEEVRATVNEDLETKLKYTYIAPTGLVSGDDIIDDEFRTMFATMNKKPLIVTKFNPETGYMTYGFAHSNPLNFSGELSDYTRVGTPYNSKVMVEEESEKLNIFKILAGLFRDDYDEEESGNTKTRTLEFSNIDYYMFRFGLEYGELKKRNNKHLRLFAKEKNGAMYLPQYENSFYFYFGMRDGSTAIDEFKKQFFAECENSTLSDKEPKFVPIISTFDICKGTSEVTPFFLNMELPYLIEINGPRDYHFKQLYEDTTEIETLELEMGDYTVRVVDGNGDEVTTTFRIGEGIVDGTFTTHDFNKTWGAQSRNGSPSDDFFIGGYLQVEGLSVSGYSGQTTIVAAPSTGNPAQAYEMFNVNENGNRDVYLASANTEYTTYVKYRCLDCSACTDVYLPFATFTLLDPSSVYLTMGPVVQTPYFNLFSSAHTENWWNYQGTHLGNYDSNSDGDDEAGLIPWNIRKSILFTGSGGTTTHDSFVRAVNGEKIIWGSPQSMPDGVLGGRPSRDIDCSEQPYSIPAGYALDDESSSWPTYGVPEHPQYYQYFAIAVNGLAVGENFVATVTGDSGVTKSYTLTTQGGLQAGRGCLFKPLPEGDLIPATVQGGNKIKCIGNPIEISMYDTGIVYPTMEYPVAKRPFMVDARYFTSQCKMLTVTPDENGNLNAEITDGAEGEKCEAEIHNGITFKKHFGGDSYMSIVAEINDEHPNSTILSAKTEDIGHQISQTSSQDRITLLSGWTSSEVEDRSYYIAEGRPMYTNGGTLYAYEPIGGRVAPQEYSAAPAYNSIVEARNLNLNTTFYDKVYVKIGARASQYIFEGNSDPEVEYFAMPMNTAIDNGIAVATGACGNFIEIGNLSYALYLVGRYTDAVSNREYNTPGTEVILRVLVTKKKLAQIIPSILLYVPFTENNSGRRIQRITKEYDIRKLVAGNWWEIIWEYITTGRIDIDFNDIKNAISAATKGQVVVADFYQLSNEAKSGTTYLTSAFSGTILSRIVKDDDSDDMVANVSAEKQLVIGRRRYKEGLSMGTVYNMYFNATTIGTWSGDISTIQVIGGDGEIIPNGTEMNVDADGDEMTITIVYPSAGTLTVVPVASWIRVKKGASSTVEGYKHTKYTITVMGADTTESQQGYVSITVDMHEEGELPENHVINFIREGLDEEPENN